MIVAHCMVEKFAAPVELCKAALRDVGRPYKGLMMKPACSEHHSWMPCEFLTSLYCGSEQRTYWDWEEKPWPLLVSLKCPLLKILTFYKLLRGK